MLKFIKKRVKRLVFNDSFMERRWLRTSPYHGTEHEFGNTFNEEGPLVGIFYDIAQEHQYYILACHKEQINYKVIDLRKSNWIELVRESGCDVFLVWPTIYKPIQKQLWDERLSILVNILGCKIFPSFDLLWIYESKRKSRDWLLSHGYAHPQTDVFFRKEDALAFVETISFPIVLKTDQGAASSGVYIIRSKGEAQRYIRRAFKQGIRLKNRGAHDRHHGYIIFQKYLPNCKEWRIMRVGESYFCRFKLKKGDFHSGSGDIIWASPPPGLLEKTREISDKFEVPNANVDYFESERGEYFINEIHALWGGKVLKDEELEGRYVFDERSKQWFFEQGDFFGNRCAELRLKWVLDNWL